MPYLLCDEDKKKENIISCVSRHSLSFSLSLSLSLSLYGQIVPTGTALVFTRAHHPSLSFALFEATA